MNILFVSNLYPPHVLGGYEMLCQEVATQLCVRGHEIRILTSDYGVDDLEDDAVRIERVLRLESDIYHYHPRQILRYPADRAHNVRVIREAISQVRPDVVFVWGMWNLSRGVAAEVERAMGDRVVYYLASAWPIEPSAHRAYWEASDGGRLGNLFRLIARGPLRAMLGSEWRLPDLRFAHALCCSAATREQIKAAGMVLGDAPVIYEGIDLTPFWSRLAYVILMTTIGNSGSSSWARWCTIREPTPRLKHWHG